MPGRGRRLLSPAATRTRHRVLAFGCALVAGVVVFVAAPIPPAPRVVAAYDAAALVLLAAFWQIVSGCDPARTQARAAEDDPGRDLILLVVLAAVVAGLLAAIELLGHGARVHDALQRRLAYLLAIVAVAAGWFLVHTAYTFRYAHLFYHEDGAPPGGLTFPGTPRPADIDFAYFAFCVGSSFAVSDIEVTETGIRREVLMHSVISFAYNSVIVAMVINVLAGIFSSGS